MKSNIFLTDDAQSFKKFICEVDLWWLGFLLTDGREKFILVDNLQSFFSLVINI